MTITSSPTVATPDQGDQPQVSREILGGDAYRLGPAAALFPDTRSGRKPSPVTLQGYIVKGITTPSNRLVKLEAARFGRSWLTSSAAVRRFLTALLEANTSAPTAEADSPPGR